MMAERRVIGINTYRLDETGSTNDVAKALAAKGCADGTVVVAQSQSHGRGRLDRLWQSESGLGVYMSVVIKPRGGLSEAALLPVMAAVAVCDAVFSVCGKQTGIKWPNDIILDGKKVGGILVETSVRDGEVDYAIIGIGINVNQTNFEEVLTKKATSLFLSCGQAFDKEQLIDKILEEIGLLFEKRSEEPLIEAYKHRCINIGKPVVVKGKHEQLTGIAEGITETGELVVLTEAGKRVTVHASEASVFGVMGYV